MPRDWDEVTAGDRTDRVALLGRAASLRVVCDRTEDLSATPPKVVARCCPFVTVRDLDDTLG
jgi:hypothetical protein